MKNENRIKSVVLVEPTNGYNRKHAFAGHNEFEPLGLEYIASVLRKENYNVVLLRQMSLDTKKIAQSIIKYNPDIVCFTVLTYNFHESLSIARIVKSFNNKIISIFGGYHPSTDFENVLMNKEVDFVVIGEGEKTILELFAAIKNNLDCHDVNGIAFKKDDAVFKASSRTRLKDIDVLPFPVRTKSILHKCKIFGLMYPPPSKQINTATVACSRGCYYNCEFCCSNTVWGKGVTFRSIENIMHELSDLKKRFCTNTIFFSDLTFNSNKDWLKELCRSLIKERLDLSWYCMCTIIGLDSELIELMSKAGCRKIGFGIESLDDKVTNEIKSFKHQSINEMNRIFDLCAINNIFTKAYLMIGLPDETHELLKEYMKEIKRMRVDELKISFYTPFPGTRAYKKYKNKLAYSDFNYFDTINYPVVKNDTITEADYKNIRREIVANFYNSSDYLLRTKKRIELIPHLQETYLEFFKFIKLSAISTIQQ